MSAPTLLSCLRNDSESSGYSHKTLAGKKTCHRHSGADELPLNVHLACDPFRLTDLVDKIRTKIGVVETTPKDLFYNYILCAIP